MLRVLPDWWIKVEEELDKVIDKLALKHSIDFSFVKDSREIEDGKKSILNAFLRIYDNIEVKYSQSNEKEKLK